MRKIRVGIGQKRRYAIVDDDDFDWLNSLKWYTTQEGYVYCAGGDVGGILCYMHHLVLLTKRPRRGSNVVHLNGDRLDNRYENLWECSKSEAMRHYFETRLRIYGKKRR